MELKQLHSNENDAIIGFAESRIGGRSENQDSYGAKQTKWGFLVTVCDGMGGGPGGKTASTIATNEIINHIESANDDEEIPNIIIKAIRQANVKIIETGDQEPQLKGMGSTATVLLITSEAAFATHVGDSRIYQLRGHKRVFRTFDHSMVFDLVRQRIITEEQARLSAQSNVITQALGIKPDIEVDVVKLPYIKGDRFLLCSDGIHGTMPEAELIKMATKKNGALGAIVDDISTFVDNKGRSSGGGHDNLTLALIQLKNNSKIVPKMSKLLKLIFILVSILCLLSITLNIVQCSTNKQSTQQQVTK